MADSSFEYCDSEEECFIGKVTEKEKTKSTQLGQNYLTPVKCSTPRSKNSVRPGSSLLPDVLLRSAMKTLMAQESTKKDGKEPTTPASSLNSSLEEVIIESVGKDDSVQIISDDDESFMRNEERLGINPNGPTVEVENVQSNESNSPLLDTNSSEIHTNQLYNQRCQMNASENPQKPEMTTDTGSVLLPMNNYFHLENELASPVHEKSKASDTIIHSDQLYTQECEKEETQNLKITDTASILPSIQSYFHLENELASPVHEKSKAGDNIIHSDQLYNQECEIEVPEETQTLKITDTASVLPPMQSYFHLENELESCVHKKSKVGDSIIHSDQLYNHECEIKVSEEVQKLKISDTVSGLPPMQSFFHLENEFASPVHKKSKTESLDNADKRSFERSGFSELNYSSLIGVSDSILNISHGSSLPSPPPEPTSKVSADLQTKIIYEDISCDGEQLFSTTNESTKTLPEPIIRNYDLHMSIDETDFQEDLGDCETTNTTYQYKTCSDISDVSSYHTARNMNSGSLSDTQKMLTAFLNYRENLDKSPLNEKVGNKSNDTKLDEDEKETSFEVVVQNRQNSFTSLPSLDKPVDEVAGHVKPRMVSKLPKYQNSTSLLKPSKLHVKEGTSNLSDNRWAKRLLKSDSVTNTSSLGKQESFKIEKPKTKIPQYPSGSKAFIGSQVKTSKSEIKTPNPKSAMSLKAKTPIQNKTTIEKSPLGNKIKSSVDSKTCTQKLLPIPSGVDKLKTPIENKQQVQKQTNILSLSFKAKTPIENKRQTQMLSSQPKRLVKSETKISKLPVKNIATSENKNLPHPLKEKNLYKNVVSPIHAYITGTPVTLQNKIRPVPEIHLLPGENKNVASHIPVKTPSPLKPKAVQRLQYGTPRNQENIAPNYMNDTLPQKILEPATAVFLKESESPTKSLPKMGSRTKVLLDTPRPKVTIHQGRTAQSPNTKGVLIPNTDVASPLQTSASVCDNRVSVRVVKSAEKSNQLK